MLRWKSMRRFSHTGFTHLNIRTATPFYTIYMFYTANPLRSLPLSALASLGLVASLWVAPTLKGRLRASA